MGRKSVGKNDVIAQKPKQIFVFVLLKRMAITASLIVLVVSLIAGAQANGLDILGALARWTSETFSFVISADDTEGNIVSPALEEDEYTRLQEAVDSCGITEKVVPQQTLDGYEMLELKTTSNDSGDMVTSLFSGPDDRWYSIQVKYHNDVADIDARIFEKDDAGVDAYPSAGKTFYILSNLGDTTATWRSGNLVETISGNISSDEIKQIIDSIGG